MGKDIEPFRRAQEREESWERHMKGESVSSIARSLGRDRRTISKYIEEETSIIAQEQNAHDLLEKAESHMQDMIQVAQRYLNDPTLKASSMAGPQWLKRWIEIVELQLKARGILRPGGSAVTMQQEGTIYNMVTLMAQDAHAKGYGSSAEAYLDSFDDEEEIVDAEVIED